jgi:thioredoxin 1
MKRFGTLPAACLFLLAFVLPLQGAGTDATVNSPPSSPKSQAVNDLYPGLTIGALTYAVASELPKGVLLKAGELVIKDKDVAEEISKAPQQMQPDLKKNALFRLEQIAMFKLLLVEARAQAAKAGKDLSEKTDQEIIQDYLRSLVETVQVSNAQIFEFYNSNAQMFGGASFNQVKPQIKQFLLQQKQQELINKHIQTIGQRMSIEISGSWLKTQAALAKDNPVDKARASGRASLVDFGSTGCVPCDMMAPVLETLRQKYQGKVNVLFVHIGQAPILANRYSVQTIPVQIFFDKTGKEVFRHVGFFPQGEIEKRLSQMGVE